MNSLLLSAALGLALADTSMVALGVPPLAATLLVIPMGLAAYLALCFFVGCVRGAREAFRLSFSKDR
ncbi:hypothetical protein [Methylocystis parvus]|uniref:hypothetical protein n=1 Tax=Methylocystis parvus TaxID=134 RepID=UPI003C721CCB